MKKRFAKYPFQGNAHGLTMFEVTHVYQLTPPPPELYTVNEYTQAVEHGLGVARLLPRLVDP